MWRSIRHQERQEFILYFVIFFLFLLCWVQLLIHQFTLLVPVHLLLLFCTQMQNLTQCVQSLNLTLICHLLWKVLNEQTLYCFNLLLLYILIIRFHWSLCLLRFLYRFFFLLLTKERWEESSLFLLGGFLS